MSGAQVGLSTNSDQTRIIIGNYYNPLLFAVGPALAEIQYICDFFDKVADFKVILDKLKFCKERCDVWLGDYKSLEEPARSTKSDTGVTEISILCGFLSQRFETVVKLDKDHSEFKPNLELILKDLSELRRIARVELKSWQWTVY